MADIDIVKKSGMGIWPWVLGLLALAALVWALTQMTGDRDRDAVVVTDTAHQTAPTAERGAAGVAGAAAGAQAGVGGAVNEYVQFVDQRVEPRAQAQGGQIDRTADHETTAEGLRRLGAALNEIGRDRGGAGAGGVEQQASTIRQRADELEASDPQAMHSDMVRGAFDAAVQAVTTLEQGAGGSGHAGTLRQAAQRVEAGTPLNAQMDAVREFFRQSRDAVQSLSSAGPAR